MINSYESEIKRLTAELAKRDATITRLQDALEEYNPTPAPYLSDLGQQIADQLPEAE